MSDLQAYLAARYMSGPKADAILDRSEDGKRRKKKRKVEASSSVASGSGGGLVIADEDGAWGAQENEDEEYKPGACRRFTLSRLYADFGSRSQWLRNGAASSRQRQRPSRGLRFEKPTLPSDHPLPRPNPKTKRRRLQK